jgi:hypothetical protein
MNLAEALHDSEITEAFDVVRSAGQFVAGGWQDTKTQLRLFGVVSVAQPDDLQMIPEGDRVVGARAFYSCRAMFVTRGADQPGDPTGTSDVLLFQGVQYRVCRVFNYRNRGYYKAIAVRMSGQ